MRCCDWIEEHDGGLRIVAVGHRVVHGGERYSEPVLVDAEVIASLSEFIPLAPLASAAQHRRDPQPSAKCCPTCRRSPASTPPSTAVSLRWRSNSRCRARITTAACAATAFTDCPTNTSPTPARHLDGGERRWPCHRRPSRQWRLDVRHAQSTQRSHDHGLHRPRGPDDGHPLRQHRPRRAALPDAISRLRRNRPRPTCSTASQACSEFPAFPRTWAVCSASSRPEAREAIDLFCYRAVREIGSLAAALGGVDALVFTGGIGEHAAPVREQICRGSAWLGIDFDAAANSAHARRISLPGSAVTVLVLPTDEEFVIARHTAQSLGL